MKSRVLLVDDHALLRKGLRLMLDAEEDLEVVGEAGDGREAIELFRKLAPDVVVMDITMKGLNGVDATRQIVSEASSTKVVALSIHSGRRYVEGMLDAGAAGYILKDSAPEDLVEGIRTVMRGEVFLSTAITGIVVSQYKSNLRRASFMAGSGQLTVRDRETLNLIVAGDSDAQIAAELNLHEDSVATARRRLMDELDVHEEADLAEVAGDLGFLAGEPRVQGQPERLPDRESSTSPIRSTKLNPPSISEDHIHRTRLVEKLNTSCDLPLTLISAPAGYGKSQLCGCWVHSCGLPSAWVSLDEDDDDLRQFLQYFLAAVSTLFPEAVEETRSLTDAPILPPVSVLADALTNDLNWIEKDFILVLDDFHRIRSEPVHNLITELLRHPPRPLHLMVITRRDPGLPLAQLRADGRVNELRTRDLRFTHPETTALLEQVEGLAVSDDILVRLEQQLEGWAVGLRLAALAIGHADRPEELLMGLSGGTQFIQDYLLHEVMAGRSPQMRDWMLKTSILDRFCEPLCTAVCAVDAPPGSTDLDGRQFIDALLRCNLFTIPLDAEGKWFRYHHLFQELLQGELERNRDPDEIATLHSRAGDWFEDHGLVDEALDHAIEGGHIEKAAGIIERNLHLVMEEGTWHIIVAWLSRLPDSVIVARPELLLARAYTHFYRMELPQIPPVLDQIEGLGDGDPLSHTLAGEVALFRGLCEYYDGDGVNSLRHLEQALDQIPVTKIALRTISESYFMFAGYLEGQEEQVRAAATTWFDDVTPLHALRKITLVHTLLLLDYFIGDLEAVKRRIPKQREFTRTHNMDNFVAWSDYLEGMSHLQQGDLDAAIRFLEVAGKSKYLHYARAAVDAMAALTIAYQVRGHPREAAASLQSLGEFANHFSPSVARVAGSCAARLGILQRRSEPAVWQPETRATRTVEPMGTWFEVPCVTHCRVIVAEGKAEGLAEAQQELQAYVEMNEAHHNTCQLIGPKTLQAIAFDRQDKAEEAMTALERAVELGRPGGFIFPFLELGPPMADLLRRLPEQDTNTAYVERILSAIAGAAKEGAAAGPRPHHVSQPLIDPLTNRELEILKLLGQRLFDKEIAAKLHVSASTVNSHCKSIYQKLCVNNRRQAVSKGTELGIL